jgi:hypothetical protein
METHPLEVQGEQKEEKTQSQRTSQTKQTPKHPRCIKKKTNLLASIYRSLVRTSCEWV